MDKCILLHLYAFKIFLGPLVKKSSLRTKLPMPQGYVSEKICAGEI
jgi:hypothetical protein